MSVDLTRHPEQSSRNLENPTPEARGHLLRKAHGLHVDHNAEVYIVVQHRENDRFLIYNSEPAENWPIPYEKLVSISARLPICRLTCAEKLVSEAADQHAQEARPAVEEGSVSAARRRGRGQSRHRRNPPPTRTVWMHLSRCSILFRHRCLHRLHLSRPHWRRLLSRRRLAAHPTPCPPFPRPTRLLRFRLMHASPYPATGMSCPLGPAESMEAFPSSHSTTGASCPSGPIQTGLLRSLVFNTQEPCSDGLSLFHVPTHAAFRRASKFRVSSR